MTNIVTVTKVEGPSKEGGAPRVFFDGKHSWADAFYVSKKISPPAQGAVIEPNTSSKTYDGKTVWFLNSFKLQSVIETQQAGVSAANGIPSGANGTAVNSVKGLPLDTKDCAIIYEVFVKACIDKELIHDRDSAFSWTEIAYRCIEQLRTGKVQAFNDKLWDAEELAAKDVKTGLAGSIEDGEPPYQADF